MGTYRRIAVNIAAIAEGLALGILVRGFSVRPPPCFQPLAVLPRILLGNLGASLALFLLGEHRLVQVAVAFLIGMASAGPVYPPAMPLLLIHGPFELLGVSLTAEAGYRFWRSEKYARLLAAGAGLVALAALLESFAGTWVARVLGLCAPPTSSA